MAESLTAAERLRQTPESIAQAREISRQQQETREQSISEAKIAEQQAAVEATRLEAEATQTETARIAALPKVYTVIERDTSAQEGIVDRTTGQFTSEAEADAEVERFRKAGFNVRKQEFSNIEELKRHQAQTKGIVVIKTKEEARRSGDIRVEKRKSQAKRLIEEEKELAEEQARSPKPISQAQRDLLRGDVEGQALIKQTEEIRKTGVSKETIAASLFGKLGFDVLKEDGGVRATREAEEVVLAKGKDVIARGRVSGVSFFPEFVKAREPPKPLTKEQIAEPLFKKLGFIVTKEEGGIRAVRGKEEVVLAKGKEVIARGRVSGIGFFPSFIGTVTPTQKETRQLGAVEITPRQDEIITEPKTEPSIIQEILAAPAGFLEATATELLGPAGKEQEIVRIKDGTLEILPRIFPALERTIPIAGKFLADITRGTFEALTPTQEEAKQRREGAKQLLTTIITEPRAALIATVGAGTKVIRETIKESKEDPIKFIAEAAVIGKGLQLIEKPAQAILTSIRKLSPKFRGVDKTTLGEKIVRGIPQAQKTGTFEAGIGKPIKWKTTKGDVGHILLEPQFKTGEYVELLHGTTKESFEKIMKEGLKTAEELGKGGRIGTDIFTGEKTILGTEPFISTTLSKDIAKAYSGEKGIIIKTRIPKKEFKKMAKKGEVFQDPFSTGEPNIAFTKTIKPSMLSEFTSKPRTFELGLISPAKPKLDINVKGFVKESIEDLAYKDIPVIPRTTGLQKDILKVIATDEEAAITGSFAQRTLIKQSRGFADIDIVTKDINKLASKIKAQLGNQVEIRTVTITDSPLGTFDIKRIIDKKTGKIIADLDPLKFAEEGIAKKVPVITVDGIKFVSPEARLEAKVTQLARGKKLDKVIKDIDILTGGTQRVGERLESPLIRGAFGFTQEEQAKFIGKKGIVTTSARDLFTVLRKKVEVGEAGLFATPFDIPTRMAQTRITRLALGQRLASIGDVLSGELTFKRAKPQIVFFPDETIGKTFKPFGFPSSELEVILPSGQIITKGKTVATTVIEGKIVPIIEGKIATPSKEAAKLLEKQILTAKETERLRKLLSKETGFDVSSQVNVKPRVAPTQIGGVSLGPTITKRITQPSFIVSPRPRIRPSARPGVRPRSPLTIAPSTLLTKAVSGEPSTPPSTPISTPPSTPPSAPPSIPPSAPPSIPPSAPPSIPPSVPPSIPPSAPPPRRINFIRPTREDIGPLTGEQEGYDVMIKRKLEKIKKGKFKGRGFKQANRVPLTRQEALGLMAETLDRYTNRSGFVKKANKKVTPSRADLVNKWNILQNKLRQSKKNPNVFVEKIAFAIDSPEEIKGIPFEAARLRKKKKIEQQIMFIQQQRKSKKVKQQIELLKTKQQTNFIGSTKKTKVKKQKQVKFI